MTGVVITTLLRRDIDDGGAYGISGTITELLVPGVYRVMLHDQRTGRCIRETWSASDGSYAFTYLNQTPKYVIAFDHTSPVQYAAIQDNVVPS